MKLSREMRLLTQAWDRGDFPKHLEWLEITNIRGWQGQRVDFRFPIVAIVGENGAGKSTLIQAAAAIYDNPNDEANRFFASDFFPDTPWDTVQDASIRAFIKEGQNSIEASVRKPSTRWRGNEDRKTRPIRYLDLKRIQPINSRTGYGRLAKSSLIEAGAVSFDEDKIERFNRIIGRTYNVARHAFTSFDPTRNIPVLETDNISYSGFHQGAGEITISELLALDIPNYSLILIDEIETSLHPRAQRRLMRDLAKISREKKVQFIITTHSPFILEEIPAQARIFVAKNDAGKLAVTGVSPEFALSRIDEEDHPEIDIFLEDNRAKILIEEIIAKYRRELLPRLKIGTFGAASVGKALGQMANQNRFSRPTIIFLDADQDPSSGCHILPGDDSPERVVFNDLKNIGWTNIASIINRSHSDLADFCEDAITQPDHHTWVNYVADRLIVGGDELWRAMSRVWVDNCLTQGDAQSVIDQIDSALQQNIQ
ncbi:ATP-binding protein [Chromobacterium violaceum]|uniref:ATP-dependent nuclease n=1 Tax=Chromobacterium violaceum TaxID=536 RepID=UPI003CE7838C